jgi:hypothetical protein
MFNIGLAVVYKSAFAIANLTQEINVCNVYKFGRR